MLASEVEQLLWVGQVVADMKPAIMSLFVTCNYYEQARYLPSCL